MSGPQYPELCDGLLGDGIHRWWTATERSSRRRVQLWSSSSDFTFLRSGEPRRKSALGDSLLLFFCIFFESLCPWIVLLCLAYSFMGVAFSPQLVEQQPRIHEP